MMLLNFVLTLIRMDLTMHMIQTFKAMQNSWSTNSNLATKLVTRNCIIQEETLRKRFLDHQLWNLLSRMSGWIYHWSPLGGA